MHFTTGILQMKINLALSALANVFALLNDANPGKGFSETNVTLAAPEVAAGNGGRNTSVLLTAIVDAGYSGTATANYTRQELVAGGAIATAKDVDVAILPSDTDAVILTKVATALGLLESELTIADLIAPTSENNPGTADIVANVDSYLYVGTYSVTLTIPDEDIPLSEALAVSDLNGFEAEA